MEFNKFTVEIGVMKDGNNNTTRDGNVVTSPLPSDMNNFFKGHKEEQQELREMISEAEIDALLGGQPAPETAEEDSKDIPEHIEQAHQNVQKLIKSAKQQILQVMNTTDTEGYQKAV